MLFNFMYHAQYMEQKKKEQQQRLLQSEKFLLSIFGNILGIAPVKNKTDHI